MHSVSVNCFASSYAGAFSQLNINLIGVFGLHSFSVAYRFRAMGFMFLYFHTQFKVFLNLAVKSIR